MFFQNDSARSVIPDWSCEKDEEAVNDRGQYSRAWKEQEIRPEHGGECPAGADVRDAGVRGAAELQRHERLQRGCGESADEIPEQEPDLAQSVLDVVPEDPKEEHVPEDVDPACVHEHRAEQRLDELVVMARDPKARTVYLARVIAPVDHFLVYALAELPQPNEGVGDDDADRDDGRRPRRDVVLERQHEGRRLRHQRTTSAISAFCACRRFSASSQTADSGP